jgi:hypothetical protein
VNLTRLITGLARGTTANFRRAARAFWDDVPGKERAARLVALVVGCWVVGGIVLAARGTLWGLLVVWCVAAWRTGRRIEREEQAEAEFVQWIYERIGDRNGVLVAELLDGLHQSGMHRDWDASVLRGVIERLGISVRDSLKVDGTVSTGVHVDDLTAVWDVQVTPPPPQEQPLPEGIAAGNYPTTSRIVQSPGEGMTIIYAADGPAAAPTVEDMEAERQRLQDSVNRVYAAREEAFEDHLADALAILREEVNGE